VSKSPSQTSFDLQTFIVKVLIIVNTENHHIYTRTERRGKGLAAKETERECVCKRQRVAENRVSFYGKNGHWRETDHFGIIFGP
jgi:hypothetical protein